MSQTAYLSQQSDAAAARRYDAGYCSTLSVDWWLSVGIITFSIMNTLFGGASIAIALTLYLIVVIRNTRLAWGASLYYLPLLCIPLLALASTLWSDSPKVTLRLSCELIVNFVLSIVVMRRMSVRSIATAMMVATILPCAFSLAIQPNAFQGTPLNGIFGSKNALAAAAQLLIACGLAVGLDPTQPRMLRLIAPVAVALGAVDVVLAQSTGATLTTVVSTATFIALTLLHRLPLGGRILIVATLGLAFAALTLVWSELITVAQDFQLHVLHKDQTITGRTELWNFSQGVIAQHPMLGHGYASFWQQGNLDAEAVWRLAGISNRAGFNFHNQFIETQVDFGLAGLCILIVFISVIAILSIIRAIRFPSCSSALMTSMLISLYSRLPVESTLFVLWSISTLVFVAIAVHSVAPLEVVTTRAAAKPSRRLSQPPGRRGFASEKMPSAVVP